MVGERYTQISIANDNCAAKAIEATDFNWKGIDQEEKDGEEDEEVKPFSCVSFIVKFPTIEN